MIKNRTPVGELTGSVTKNVGTTAGSTGSQTTLSGLVSSDVSRGSVTVTPTEATNLVILRFSTYATNDSNIEIREDTDVLATVDAGGTGTRTINLVLEDVTVESHTYTGYTVFDTQSYQYSTGGTIFYGAPVNVADTHTAEAKPLNNIIQG